MKWWPPTPQRRWLLLAIAITTVGLAGYWLVFEPPAEQAGIPAPRPAARPAVSPGAASSQAASPESPGTGTPPAAESAPLASGIVDIFAVRDWEPPPPVADTTPAAPAPPPPPQAPPLPFRFLGKVDEVGKGPVFFLGQDERILAVRPGDLIDNTYRVGRLEGGELHFLYRPLKIQQTLSVGGNS